MIHVFYRAIKIFGYSSLFRLFISIVKNKFNLFKVFRKEGKPILNFGFVSSMLSFSFLFARWVLYKMKIYFEFEKLDKNIVRCIEKIELFTLGFIVSFLTMLYNKSELNFLKLLVYMRAIEGFFVLLK